MEGNLFDLVENNPRLTIEFCYHGMTDYTVRIQESFGAGEYLEIARVQGCDRVLVCAMAYTKVAEYLIDTRNGY